MSVAVKVTSRLAEIWPVFWGGTCGRREMTNCKGDVNQTTEPQKETVCSKE